MAPVSADIVAMLAFLLLLYVGLVLDKKSKTVVRPIHFFAIKIIGSILVEKLLICPIAQDSS